jgi:two-component sensor histidine kinase
MNHRVKNLFAVASGVIALSARSALTPKDLAASAQARLNALSRAHELILPCHTGDEIRTVDLTELVRMILTPYDQGDQRVALSGIALECGPSTSSSLALLLHEFATNSVKYGALSDPDGLISVSWEVRDDVVTLAWAEESRVRPRKSNEIGFGSFLVNATVRSLDAQCDQNWHDAGLTIHLKIPTPRFSA